MLGTPDKGFRQSSLCGVPSLGRVALWLLFLSLRFLFDVAYNIVKMNRDRPFGTYKFLLTIASKLAL